jgi:anti-sigma B factor antagonist
MEYTLEIQEKILFVNITGDFLGENTDQLTENVKEKMVAEKLQLCGIDLSGIRYMNSSGIGTLINILNIFKQNEGEAMLLTPPPGVKKNLEMMKLHTVFSIVDSKEEAINQLRKIII